MSFDEEGTQVREGAAARQDSAMRLNSAVAKERPRVVGREVSGFDPWHVVADCAGVPTYFSLEFGQRYQDAVGAPGTPRRQDLFDDFVEAAGKRLGCSTPTS